MISLPQKPKIIKKEGNKAIFEIEGLSPGYGVTVGNSLRRVLISSLEGAAATQFKIKNVNHEFSTIPGVMEDAVTLMLNLKQLRFKMFVNDPQKITLKVKGEKEVRGSDFEIPAQLEMINPDCHIATLTSKSAELEMEIQVERGVGYSPRELRRGREKVEIGVIPLDAIFTPIRRVGFKVENMRVGERIDFDKLFLEIETDGTTDSEIAFSRAAKILVEHFSLLAESFKEEALKEIKIKAPIKKHAKKEKRKKTK